MLDVHPASESIDAVLLVLPALLASYIFRPGEHALVAQLFVRLRRLVALMTAMSFFAASSLAVHLPDWWRAGIWVVATLVACWAAAATGWVWLRMRLRR